MNEEMTETVASLKLDDAIDEAMNMIDGMHFEEHTGIEASEAMKMILDAVNQKTVKRRGPFGKALRNVRALAIRTLTKPSGAMQVAFQIKAIEHAIDWSEAMEDLNDA